MNSQTFMVIFLKYVDNTMTLIYFEGVIFYGFRINSTIHFKYFIINKLLSQELLKIFNPVC